MLKTNPLFENRSKLFTLTIFAVIGILAIPVILPHIFHKFQILDPYLFNKTVNSIDYDFSVIEGKSDVIFHKSGKTGNDGSVTTISVPFPSNYTGSFTIGFENLNGNSFADSEFSAIVMNPVSSPEFPSTSLYVLFGVLVLMILLTRINFVKWNNHRM